MSEPNSGTRSPLPSPTASEEITVMAHTAEVSTHKSNKYDRQLRLWGDHGQAALEKARVCLIHATATGTETLKNLVLPGIGYFCIVDAAVVAATDLGSNFFVTAQSLGSPRAEVTTRLLLEMNGDVKGDYIVETLESLLEHRPPWFLSFSVVIAADIQSEKSLLRLSKILWDARVPLVICRTYGMVGVIRIATQEHHVVESKPDNSIDDLRLENPFPELQELVNVVDLKTLTKQEHAHVPWVVVMLKLLGEWKQAGHGAITSFKEKKAFQEFIDAARLKNEDGVPFPEENFDEARKAVFKSFGAPKVPSEIAALFTDRSCVSLTCESAKFWIIVRALRDFVQHEGGGYLPLSGALPDMTSDTESFVRLQSAYRTKADADALLVHKYVQDTCSYIGLAKDLIKLSEVKYYCRKAGFLRSVRTRSLADEYEEKNGLSNGLQGTSVEEAAFRCSMWYIMLRSVDSFFLETTRYPGSDDNTMEADVYHLKSHVQKFLKSFHPSQEFTGLLTEEVLDAYCQEATKFGGEQVHSIAAFIGGCVGQEVIKLLTGQYIPLNDTLVYDGAASVTWSFGS